MTKNCIVCGTPYETFPGNRLTCGNRECSAELDRRKNARCYQKRKGIVRLNLSDDALDRKADEVWARKATPDTGRQARSPLCDVARWL